jgi:hypothetical protein
MVGPVRDMGVEDKPVELRRAGIAARHPRWVRVAVVVTLLFTALHVYWAVGGTWGLPPAARLHEQATRTANWVVSAILVVGAGWLLLLARPASRRIPPWLLLSPLWLGAVVCISHAIFGFATKGLYLAGFKGAVHFPVIPGVDAGTASADNRDTAVLDLLVFEPFFLAQGLAIVVACRQFVSTRRGRRVWTWSVVAGTLMIDGFGVALAVAGLRVAIG